jgi:hypothetical protein
MNNIPDCFVLTDREQCLPYRKSTKINDIKVGKFVYEVPESYWCRKCNGTGGQQCKETGIARKKDRR